jgi:hypothetical protein
VKLLVWADSRFTVTRTEGDMAMLKTTKGLKATNRHTEILLRFTLNMTSGVAGYMDLTLIKWMDMKEIAT